MISAAYTEQRGGPWQEEHAANTTVRGRERNFLAFRHFLFLWGSVAFFHEFQESPLYPSQSIANILFKTTWVGCVIYSQWVLINTRLEVKDH